MKDGKIIVVENEAEQVRLIYRRYLELSGVNALVTRLLATGASRGGLPFERGTLFSTSCETDSISARSDIRVRSCPASSQPSWTAPCSMQCSRS